MTLILSNEDVASVFDMDRAITLLEDGYRELGEGRAVIRPRAHSYMATNLPDTSYMFKSFEGGLERLGSTPSGSAPGMHVCAISPGQSTSGRRRPASATRSRQTGSSKLDTGAPVSGFSPQTYRGLLTAGLLLPAVSPNRYRLADLRGPDQPLPPLEMAIIRRLDRLEVDALLGLDFLSQFARASSRRSADGMSGA